VELERLSIFRDLIELKLMSVQEELDQMRDAHRRTALQFVCQLLREDHALTRGQLLLRLRADMRHSEWFEFESNIQHVAEAVVDQAMRITAEHGTTPSAKLDLAISSVDFSALRAQ
jgi:hypothetical protein